MIFLKFKRIIAFACSFVILSNVFLFRSSAVNQGVTYVLTVLADYLVANAVENAPGAAGATWAATHDPCEVSPTGYHEFMKQLVDRPGGPTVMADHCQHCGVAYSSFYSQSYDQYVTDLETDLGTTTLIDGGIRIYFPSVVYYTASGNTVDTINLGYTSSALVSIGSYGGSGAYMSRRVVFGYDGVVALLLAHLLSDMIL